MAIHKHFSLSERIKIEEFLNKSYSFKAIARELNRDCTTISKEVKKHIIFKRIGSYGQAFNNCKNAFKCNRSRLCKSMDCKYKYCKLCAVCYKYCSEFEEEKCLKLSKPPYVCNGCPKRKNCRLEKSFYSAENANQEYKTLLSTSRDGINTDSDELKRIDNFITPLIKNGQSIHHVCANNKDIIMCSEKTIYNYIDLNLFTARNIDMPRKVRYRPRKNKPNLFKVDKICRNGRTYEDFNVFIKQNPDTPIVEMDTVEGIKGGKVLLTIHFIESQFMLAFLREANTSQSVIDIFNYLYNLLTPEVFKNLFKIILTDNGSEFSNPKALEFDSEGFARTKIFYCDPYSSYQKGSVENNQELIRRVIPKGTSFNNFTQQDINKMMNHINSYGRKKLNHQCPHLMFSLLHGNTTLEKLGAILIPSNDIILLPKLLKK
jgi:IS30 family transposase